ncbi:MAG: tRNA threonylcarbamoyladenosine dehydratase [Burkholderiaceae bacterium]
MKQLLDDVDLAIDLDRRFGGLARLYGAEGLARLRASRVAVVGLGGVGSWVAEACARSGIGALTLIDLDHVAESNINRQIHALDSTLGAAKVVAMASRVHDINPQCVVEAVEEFVEAGNVATLIPPGRFDFVIDAIDHVRAKTALIAHCHAQKTPLVTIGGAGGRTDVSRIRVADLAHTEHEAMLAKVRKALRTHHDFPRNVKRTFGVNAVYSDQRAGERTGMTGLNCAGFGSSVVVTATFGFVAAGLLVDRLARGQ